MEKAEARAAGASSATSACTELCSIMKPKPVTTKPVATPEPEKIIEAEVEKKPVEKPPFDVAATTETTTETIAKTSEQSEQVEQVKGDADESTIPTSADQTFQAAVMEIEILLPQIGWTPDKVIPVYNKLFSVDHMDLGQFTEEQLEFILSKIRSVKAKHEAGELGKK